MRGLPPARTGTTPRAAARKRSRIAVSRGPYTATGRRMVKGCPDARSSASAWSFDRPYEDTGRGGSAAHTGWPFRLGPPAAWDEMSRKWAPGAAVRAASATLRVPPAFEVMYSASDRADVLPAA